MWKPVLKSTGQTYLALATLNQVANPKKMSLCDMTWHGESPGIRRYRGVLGHIGKQGDMSVEMVQEFSDWSCSVLILLQCPTTWGGHTLYENLDTPLSCDFTILCMMKGPTWPHSPMTTSPRVSHTPLLVQFQKYVWSFLLFLTWQVWSANL